jgi:hypothetical protein
MGETLCRARFSHKKGVPKNDELLLANNAAI